MLHEGVLHASSSNDVEDQDTGIPAENFLNNITEDSYDVRAPVLCSVFPKIYTAGLDHVFNYFHCMSSALMPM